MKNIISIIAIISLSFLSGCGMLIGDKEKAKEILESNGYKNVQMTGYEWFGCSEDDTFHEGFTATSPGNQVVSGVVCSGWLKGSTIRLK